MKPEHHRFLIGRGGANIRMVRENTGARVVFPTSADEDKELITIIGRKEGLNAAEEELLKSIKELVSLGLADPSCHKHDFALHSDYRGFLKIVVSPLRYSSAGILRWFCHLPDHLRLGSFRRHLQVSSSISLGRSSIYSPDGMSPKSQFGTGRQVNRKARTCLILLDTQTARAWCSHFCAQL